jgi:hypothetical protein
LAEEDGIEIDHETFRRWKKHCQRRERKAHFGELVQLDGSFHD